MFETIRNEENPEIIYEIEEDEIISSDEESDEDLEAENFPSTFQECKSFLRNLWDGLTPPIPEEDLIGGWYAGMFLQPGKKKGTLCVGKITKRFLKANFTLLPLKNVLFNVT